MKDLAAKLRINIRSVELVSLRLYWLQRKYRMASNKESLSELAVQIQTNIEILMQAKQAFLEVAYGEPSAEDDYPF